jgi:glutamyl-tRNA synthetase/glutamyl-Q tRNA(Asp) synthetase
LLVTRFAPAPTGYLHLGHVVNALHVWGIAKELGAQVILRVEDHDRIRCKAAYEAAIREDLDWLGFVADSEAPRQSERSARYADVMTSLEARGLAYPCDCSRKDIAAEAGDVFNEETRYPGRCRDRRVDPASTPARRIVMEAGAESFDDLIVGSQSQAPATQCGDFLARDRNGNWTYQFAVTVDDFDQGVNLIIRGTDLLASTGRQIRLARLLGRATMPAFAHHTLVRRPDGAKLSKSDGDTGIRELRRRGLLPAEVLSIAGESGGGLRPSIESAIRGYSRISR